MYSIAGTCGDIGKTEAVDHAGCAVKISHKAATMVVGASYSGAVSFVVYCGWEYTAVIDSGGTIGGASDSTNVASLAYCHLFEHNVADGGIGGSGENWNLKTCNNGEGAVGLGLGG